MTDRLVNSTLPHLYKIFVLQGYNDLWESWLVVLGLYNATKLRSYHGGRWRICVSRLCHITTFPSKAHDYFSHMLPQRWEAKIGQKEKSLQLGIKLTTTRSWVRHAHHWATQAGLYEKSLNPVIMTFRILPIPKQKILLFQAEWVCWRQF